MVGGDPHNTEYPPVEKLNPPSFVPGSGFRTLMFGEKNSNRPISAASVAI